MWYLSQLFELVQKYNLFVYENIVFDIDVLLCITITAMFFHTI